MPTNTTNMALPKPIDSDNAEVALASSIPSAFDKIDVHRHTGGTDGLQIGTTAIPTNAVLVTPTLTVPTITNPLITGTVAGAATYTAPLITGPTITGTILGTPVLPATSPLTVDAYRVVVNDSTLDSLLLNGTGVSSSAGAVSVTFSHAFSNTPIVVATPVTATLGLIGITIASVSATGFTFRCYDSNNVILNGIVIDYIAFGAR